MSSLHEIYTKDEIIAKIKEYDTAIRRAEYNTIQKDTGSHSQTVRRESVVNLQTERQYWADMLAKKNEAEGNSQNVTVRTDFLGGC